MSHHHQTAQPFDLPDGQVKAPNGKCFGGRRAKVYWLLRETRRLGYQFTVGKALAPPGWVPLWALREPWSGGGSGDRRVRELRFFGYDVRHRELDGTDSTIYRLVGKGEPPAAPAEPPTDSSPAELPLQGLAVRLAPYAEPEPPVQQIAPGHLLWPEGPREQYLEQLRRGYQAGRLFNGWTGRTEVGLVFADGASAEAPSTLADVLTKLGAHVVGAKQQTLFGGES